MKSVTFSIHLNNLHLALYTKVTYEPISQLQGSLESPKPRKINIPIQQSYSQIQTQNVTPTHSLHFTMQTQQSNS